MTTTAETPATRTAVDEARDRLQRQEAGAPDADQRLDIAEMAARTGVTAHTLRYYERIGLLAVERDASGHRSYTAADFGRVVFLSRLRMTGMPVRELQRYIELAARGEHTVPERLALLEAHRDAVRAQLTELTFALRTIEMKIDVYGGGLAP
ncbi:MAG: MerR family transcriptional regulator [Pseudonocardia sp.]|nr:MerR family transcriptional regulator [Pseudonocardia sp.]